MNTIATATRLQPAEVALASADIRVVKLFISPGHNFFGHHQQPPGRNSILERAEIHCLAGRGIEGDRFFDHKENYQGQITFFAIEVFEEVCKQLEICGKSPGVARRNVVTAGVDLNTLIGEEFTVQGIRFAGVEECRPCYWMDQVIAPGAETALRGRGGLRARILTDGCLRAEAESRRVSTKEL
jgi:MOSC domain-containing protein YiiM